MKLKVIIKTPEINSKVQLAKDRFWLPIIENGLSSHDTAWLKTSSKCETFLRNTFPSHLKSEIERNLDSQIRDIERSVLDKDYWRMLEDFRFRNLNGEKYEDSKEYYRLFTITIQESIELRKTLFANNEKYKELLEKRVLASQFVFTISKIEYASLEFDLNIEPAQKVIDFFDSNFEYLQVFLGSYIADTFNNKFNHNNEIELNYSVVLESNLKSQTTQSKLQQNNLLKPEIEKEYSKLEKAKWYWSVVNGSLIFPVIISIYLIYSYSDKLNKLQEIQNQKLNPIFESQDKLINHYQEEIKRLERLELQLNNPTMNKDSISK